MTPVPPPNPPPPPAAPASIDELREFTWRVHTYTNEYIRFADAKAGAVFAIGSAVVGALWVSKAHLSFVESSPIAWTGRAWLMLLSFILLAVGMLTSGVAVRPRLWTTQSTPGLLFWERVAAHTSGTSYWTALTASRPEELSRQVAEHVYDLAKVARAKYRWASVATNVTLAGAILGSALLVLGKPA